MQPLLMDLLAAVGVAFTLLASMGAKVFRHFSHRQLEIRCRARRRRGLFSEILDRQDELALAAEKLQSLGLCFVVAVVTVRIGPWLSEQHPVFAVGIVAAAALAALMVTVWIPWAVVRHASPAFLLNTWWFWRQIHWVGRPLGVGSLAFDGLLRRLTGQPKRDEREEEEEAFEDEIMTMVSTGQREGLLEADTREMIEGVMELGDADVADIMTPRSQVDALDADLDWSEFLPFVVDCGRTRIPVYDQNPDNVIGVLYVKDLLPELAKPHGEPRAPLRALVREPWFIPSTIPLDDLLQDFLKNRKHLAVVLDEYGAVEGVVTIEDVLEEIVGEIMDESDEVDDGGITFFNEHRSRVQGFVHIHALNERLGLTLPESDEYDTVGGFLVSRLTRIPKRGESVSYEGVKFTVVESTPRHVVSVLVESGDQPAAPRAVESG